MNFDEGRDHSGDSRKKVKIFKGRMFVSHAGLLYLFVSLVWSTYGSEQGGMARLNS